MVSAAYPKGSFILLAMTAFEAGAFAIFIVLNPIFWRESVGVSEKTAGDANFIYGFLLNFTPLITAFLADNFWGRYAVLGLHCVFFVIGFGLTTASSIISLPFSAMLGGAALLLVSTAVGINKVILPTFNADQFQSHDEETRNKMFSWYYFAVNLASIISILTVGNLKDFFTCYNKPCYAYVYGSCTGLVLISTILFFVFTRWFIRAPASKNILVEAVKCFLFAVKNRIKGQRKVSLTPTKSSLLDYASPTYSDKFILDLKQALKVASLFFIGIPYWTCYQTMFNAWSRQYTMVDGSVGPLTITFLMYIILDPITIVISIFLQNSYVIPFLNKFTTVTPLKKMAVGGLCAVLCYAFVIGVEYKVTTDELKPLGTGAQVGCWKQSSIEEGCKLKLMNNASLELHKNYTKGTFITVPSLTDGEAFMEIDVGVLYSVIFECPNPRFSTILPAIQFQPGVTVFALYPTSREDSIYTTITVPYSRLENTKTALDLISCRNIELAEKTTTSSGLQFSARTVSLKNCSGPSCTISFNLKGKLGSRQVIIDDTDCSKPNVTSAKYTQITAVPGFSVSGLYMWPQGILFGLSESLLAVGALEFAYTQTSSSMKAFMQALWLLTAAFGNILGFLLNQIGMSPFLSHSVQGGIMFLFTSVFIGAAWRCSSSCNGTACWIVEYNFQYPQYKGLRAFEMGCLSAPVPFPLGCRYNQVDAYMCICDHEKCNTKELVINRTSLTVPKMQNCTYTTFWDNSTCRAMICYTKDEFYSVHGCVERDTQNAVAFGTTFELFYSDIYGYIWPAKSCILAYVQTQEVRICTTAKQLKEDQIPKFSGNLTCRTSYRDRNETCTNATLCFTARAFTKQETLGCLQQTKVEGMKLADAFGKPRNISMEQIEGNPSDPYENNFDCCTQPPPLAQQGSTQKE